MTLAQNSPSAVEPSCDIAVLEHKLSPDQREEFMAGLVRYCKAYQVKLREFYPEALENFADQPGKAVSDALADGLISPTPAQSTFRNIKPINNKG